MSVIRQLPREVVERIAAGEVIERPASVVKELVENAIDARATAISVSIERGGLGLVRVSDDGCGLDADDLALAFSAHATSKLVDVDDLAHIGSLGFRGEALSSIGAVSHARITSAVPGADCGHRVECAASRVGAVEPVAAAPGTTVEVRDLFFNTPARRAFLSSPSAESARCREVCAQLALGVPGVRFRFESDGRARLVLDAADSLRERIAAVHGADFVDELLPLERRADGLRLEGWVSRPSAARPRPRVQVVLVNGHPVQDRTVMASVRTTLRDFLPPSLQPSYVLALTIDPARVDVNVHPTKAEVRFRDRDDVFRAVRSATRQAMLDADLAPRVRAEHIAAAGAGGAAETPRPSPPSASSLFGPTGGRVAEARPDAAPRGTDAHRDDDGAAALPPAAVPTSEPTSPLAVGAAPRPARRYLQVLDTYLVLERGDGLVVIDQHALHERILYARLQADRDAGRLHGQRLLVPHVAKVTAQRHARLLELREPLLSLGVELEDFGADTVAVHSVPAVLRHESVDDLLDALADPPDLHGGIPDGLDRRLFTMACHAAIKAGDRLDEDQIADLLRQGEELEHAATCPHGRPTTLVIGREEFERLFKRSGF